MPRAGEFARLLPQIREDLRDYRVPGWHLHRPRALGVVRLPSGRIAPEASTIPEGSANISTAPGVILWSFAMLETAPGAALVVSPELHGPALIDFLHVTFDPDNTAPRPSLGLRWSVAAPTPGTGLTLDAAVLGTNIIDTGSLQVEGAGAEFQDARAFAKFSLGTGGDFQDFPLRYPVFAPLFFLNLAMGTQGVGAHRAAGYVRVVTRLAPEDLRNFL